MVAGDTHGNTPFVAYYLIPVASALGVDQIIQVGDFGYWEHSPEGVDFLDSIDQVLGKAGIPLYWLHGNHDKTSLLLDKYKRLTIEGFIEVRKNVFYIPQGLSWQWQDNAMHPYSADNAGAVTARAFGGAYSIDKTWRLDIERQRGEPESLWFPEEEMTDADMDLLLAGAKPRTIVFSHDKPRSSDPGVPLKDWPACQHNQDRLQRALLAHQPKMWIHGHLHHRYVNTVRCGDDKYTSVIGLSCDDRATDDEPTHAFVILDIESVSDGDGDHITRVILGDSEMVKVSREDLRAARERLAPSAGRTPPQAD